MHGTTRYGPLGAIPAALTKTWDMTTLTLRMLWKMLEGVVSPKNISGPINIAQYAGVSASMGLVAFASFLAVVSISLGIINLMPVPMLDGGQLLYHFAELITGKPLPERVQMIGHQAGLVLLAMLMTFAFYNDIARLLD
jgi:regulator of sigma E protease